MRTLPLEGPRARYDRIKLLTLAEDFGKELLPDATAPFAVRWDAQRRRLSLLLDETLVAEVKVRDEGGVLDIRDVYPERFDFALLRAVRNVADMTDEVGKLKRAVDKEKSGETGLFTRTPVAFATRIQDWDVMHKALRGAEALNKKLCVQMYTPEDLDDYFSIYAHFGRARHRFNIRCTQNGLRVTIYDETGYGLREETLNDLLDAGLALYDERMTPERLEAACRKLIAETGDVDAETIHADYHSVDKTRNEEAALKVGPFTTFKRGYWPQHRFNGVRFAQQTIRPLECLPAGVIVDQDLVEDAAKNLTMRWEALAIGKRISDYPLLTEALISARIENTDFGYDA